jgi:membrane protease YdiL (CAAX protease family)
MNPYVLPIAFVALVLGAIIYLNESRGLLRIDHLDTPARKFAAYLWLALLLLPLAAIVTSSALHPTTARDLLHVPFYSLFTLHFILIIFLVGWWLIAGRPPLREFLNLRSERSGEMLMAGVAIGVGGWILTIIAALVVGVIVSALGLMPKPEPSPMIAWLAALPLWKKIIVVLSAMTVEEAFFRGFLQKRLGLIASTILFALAHSGFGQPLLLVGVGCISLIIGFAFYRTKNLLPGIIAHGVFDAIQLFVIIPIAYKTLL